jgi:hypothetical protein
VFTDLRGYKHFIGVKGAADIVGCTAGGRALAVEIKTGKAVRSKEQLAFAGAWARKNGLYILARYSDAEDGDATIREALAEKNPDAS